MQLSPRNTAREENSRIEKRNMSRLYYTMIRRKRADTKIVVCRPDISHAKGSAVQLRSFSPICRQCHSFGDEREGRWP
jgi:hypothetical protein